MAISSNIPKSLAIGIEIGGTKIQVGIGSTSGKLVQLPIRKQVIQGNRAEGIRRDLITMVVDAFVSVDCSLSDIFQYESRPDPEILSNHRVG